MLLHFLAIVVLYLLFKLGISAYAAVVLYLLFTQIDHAIFLPIAWYSRFKRTAKQFGVKAENKGWMSYTFTTILSGLAAEFSISGNQRGNSAMTLLATIELADCPPDLVVGSEASLGSQERNKGATESFQVGEPDLDRALWFSAEDTERAKDYLTVSRLAVLSGLALAYPSTTLENQRLTVKVKSSFTPTFTARNHKRFFDDVVRAASALSGDTEEVPELPDVKAHQIRQVGRAIAPLALMCWGYGWFFRSVRIDWSVSLIDFGGVLQIVAVSGLFFWLVSLSGSELARRFLSLYWFVQWCLSLSVLVLGVPTIIQFMISSEGHKGVWAGSLILSCFYFLPGLYWWAEATRVRGHLKALR